MSFTLGKGFFLVFCIITEEEIPLKLLVENRQDWYCLRLKALWEPVNYVDGILDHKILEFCFVQKSFSS